MTEATLLYHEQERPSDIRLAKLSEFLGVKCNLVKIAHGQSHFDFLIDYIKKENFCVMASASTVGFLLKAHPQPELLKQHVFDHIRYLFIYGFHPEALEISAAQQLTDGLVSSISGFRHSNHRYHVGSSFRAITKEFTDLSFGPINNQTDFGIAIENPCKEFLPIISINGTPFFATLQRGSSTLFFLACNQIADLEEKSKGTFSVVEHFSRLLPAMMFIKYVFKEKCWHNKKRYANLIIDDPLLRESYGFLNYRQLLKEMDRHSFSTTIAFIPYNYKRTNRSISELFRTSSYKYSICVHGCNHNKGEFAITDLEKLKHKVRSATYRMEVHEKVYRLPYTKVMVFPQGKFSKGSLKILGCNNYLAAVNSEIIPSDFEPEDELKIVDFLDIAITRYDTLPIFLRRYPGELVHFAFDLFLGKPLLIVEHHTVFEKGYHELSELVEKVKSLNTDIEWKGLGEIMNKTYLEKKVSDEVTECKIYTNHQIIENKNETPQKYFIIKNENGKIPIEKVSIDDKNVPFTINHNRLHLRVEIPPKQSKVVQITYRNYHPDFEVKESLKEKTGIYVRRYLSEFRDNFLCKHQLLLSTAERIRRRLNL